MTPRIPNAPYPLVVVVYEDVVYDVRAFDIAEYTDWVTSLNAMAAEFARQMSLTGESVRAVELDIANTYRDVSPYDTLRVAHYEDVVIRQSDEVHEHFLGLLADKGVNIIR